MKSARPRARGGVAEGTPSPDARGCPQGRAERFALLLALTVVGCAGRGDLPGASPAVEPVGDTAGFTRRGASAPEPRARANSGAHVVSLRAPVSLTEAERLLNDYFSAIAAESNTELAALLSEEATLATSTGVASSALVAWVRRFAQLEYQSIDPASVFDRSRLELYSAEEFALLEGRRRFALAPKEAQLLLVVPLAPSEVSGKARFGDQLELLLSRTETGLEIRAIHERGFLGP